MVLGRCPWEQFPLCRHCRQRKRQGRRLACRPSRTIIKVGLKGPLYAVLELVDFLSRDRVEFALEFAIRHSPFAIRHLAPTSEKA
jgi:hypothetical protein